METNENSSQKLDTWALIELFGHQKIVGKVTEASIAGGAFIRCDVPAVDENKPFTRFFSPGAIYSINPIDEDIALQMIKQYRNEPVHRFQFPQLAEKAGEEVTEYDNQA